MGALLHHDIMPFSPIINVKIFDVLEIDFMGPFPRSFSFVYVLIFVYYVPEWVEAPATRTNDHKVVASL